jgi:hypothetical protein
MHHQSTTEKRVWVVSRSCDKYRWIRITFEMLLPNQLFRRDAISMHVKSNGVSMGASLVSIDGKYLHGSPSNNLDRSIDTHQCLWIASAYGWHLCTSSTSHPHSPPSPFWEAHQCIYLCWWQVEHLDSKNRIGSKLDSHQAYFISVCWTRRCLLVVDSFRQLHWSYCMSSNILPPNKTFVLDRHVFYSSESLSLSWCVLIRNLFTWSTMKRREFRHTDPFVELGTSNRSWT